MAVEVTIYLIPQHPRSLSVCKAMEEGIRKMGDRPRIRSSVGYTRPDGEIAVFYGLAGRLVQTLKDYSVHGKKAVYVDLGYWGRKDGGRFAGFHKLSVNARHPTAYFQRRPHGPERARALGLEVKPWREGRPIIVAGMGPKGARAEGFQPTEWERRTITTLRRHTERPIIYRPKPNWLTAQAIAGADIRRDTQTTLGDLLGEAHALVAHHSNACVEALQAGVPIFTEEGVSLPMGSRDLSQIETPRYPDGREQWLHDLAWCQWSVEEMATGAPWRHLKDEGLIP